MRKVAIDFGTGNTVLAVYNETLQQCETVAIPEFSIQQKYMLPDSGSGESPTQQSVDLIPSLIHYGETDILIGAQVISRGLCDHPATFRWMKRGIAQRISKRKKTPQGHISPQQAGEDFLTRVLTYAGDRLSLADDEFTFTAPVEAFEDFQDWLRTLCENLGIERVRLLDEPTACVLGYQGMVRQDERFAVFDFGCGTLDVSIVRIDLLSQEDRKAVVLGQAGRDLGGMDVDRWLADDFVQRNGLDNHQRRRLEPRILAQAEEAKILLSRPAADEADINVLDDGGVRPKVLRSSVRPARDDCRLRRNGAPVHRDDACLGCLLEDNQFSQQIKETLERALENAAVKSGVRRDDITKVLVTGGTSLIPGVREQLAELFPHRVDLQNPFDAVARGAGRGLVAPILQHDYAIEGYDRQKKDYVFKPLFKIGTEYPTQPDAIRFWVNGSYDGQTKVELKIYEVSRMKRRSLSESLVDAEGVLRDDSRVASEYSYICLNRDDPMPIIADPPVSRERDRKRFLCSFRIDGNRRLLVTVTDNFSGKMLYEDYPVVRL